MFVMAAKNNSVAASAGGARASPPSQKGKYRKDPDGKTSQRCICCDRSGTDVSKKGSSTKQLGLEMLGHQKPNTGKGDDLRFAPLADRGIPWVKKRNQTAIDVEWPDGTGPMCLECADMCRGGLGVEAGCSGDTGHPSRRTVHGPV